MTKQFLMKHCKELWYNNLRVVLTRYIPSFLLVTMLFVRISSDLNTLRHNGLYINTSVKTEELF